MTKEIRYDRSTKDFAMYLNGEYVGSRSDRTEAQVELDRLAYEALTH